MVRMASISNLISPGNLSLPWRYRWEKTMLVMCISLTSGYPTMQTETECALASTDSISYYNMNSLFTARFSNVDGQCQCFDHLYSRCNTVVSSKNVATEHLI